ncbi:MAG: cysteine--tRNA ligase, partial [Nitrospirae bacterium]
MDIILYNTLTQKKEIFKPVREDWVGIYTCGPTVYRSAHIGNLRIYLMADWLRRILEYMGYNVRHVKNITDVGHMRQEMLDRGEDKIIAAARAAGKSSKEIAQYYTEEFLGDERRLNIKRAHFMPKATEHIDECISLIEKIIKKGYAYEVNGTIYFDVSRFKDYGKLSKNRLQSLLKGVRVEVDHNKRSQMDFALWKAAEEGREMKWKSPWGEGFPGWHIECSAMSMKYLGEEIDIHTGGVDNIFPHHENEIAQSEAAVGHEVVRYWIHGQHLLCDNLKMAKSTGNAYTLSDIENRGFDPLSFRYLSLTAHFSSRLNFTFKSLKSAQRGLTNLRDMLMELYYESKKYKTLNPEICDKWKNEFIKRICNNMDLPGAFALTETMLKGDELNPYEKLSLLFDFDRVLGLDLEGFLNKHIKTPDWLIKTIKEREKLRSSGRFKEADEIRLKLRSRCIELKDKRDGTAIRYISEVESRRGEVEYSSSKEVPSLLNMPNRRLISFVVVGRNNYRELMRCVESIERCCGDYDYEIVLVDNGSTDGTNTL